MKPKISHRCPSCGVSVRDFGERAMFCPECGKPLMETNSAQPGKEGSAKVGERAGHADTSAPVVVPPEQISSDKVAGIESETAPPAEDRHRGRERTRETLHRASNMARGAIEDNVKRVEKIHHVSTVMLEEATYDPSLRFVLVALGLFVVFVILLILSKVMG
jgi:predicted  nucleic acid-binding Zn-ribbon protein